MLLLNEWMSCVYDNYILLFFVAMGDNCLVLTISASTMRFNNKRICFLYHQNQPSVKFTFVSYRNRHNFSFNDGGDIETLNCREIMSFEIE